MMIGKSSKHNKASKTSNTSDASGIESAGNTTYLLQRAASLERIANTIRDEMLPQITVLMLGYNGKQRQETLHRLIWALGGDPYHVQIHDCTYVQDVERLELRGFRKVHIIDLKFDIGRDPNLRSMVIAALRRKRSVSTVVGVYCSEPWPDMPAEYNGVPPRAEEFDYFVTVTKGDAAPS